MLKPLYESDINKVKSKLTLDLAVDVYGSLNFYNTQYSWENTTLIFGDKDIQGVCEITIYSDDPRIASITTYVFEQNKGIGSKVMPDILDFLFNVLYVDVIVAKIYSHNQRSIHFHEKFGFKYVGRETNIRRVNGKFVDLLHYELTYDRWLNDIRR